jgi:16S rRNA (cytosine1402-N4)-methyltransferase
VDKPLDMRMDKNQKFSAKDVVNFYNERELNDILFTYGEEKFAKNITKNILEARKIKPIETTGELVSIIEKSIPKKFQQNGHPAKKTFQAIRIEVNKELDNLKETVIAMAKRLKEKGRLVILTFHSLEDRAVKQAFKELEIDCICDKSLPVCICGKKREGTIITRHPIVASDEELSINSRSKSAKLRIFEKSI